MHKVNAQVPIGYKFPVFPLSGDQSRSNRLGHSTRFDEIHSVLIIPGGNFPVKNHQGSLKRWCFSPDNRTTYKRTVQHNSKLNVWRIVLKLLDDFCAIYVGNTISAAKLPRLLITQTVGIQAHGDKVRQLAICFSLSGRIYIRNIFFRYQKFRNKKKKKKKHCGHEFFFLPFGFLVVNGLCKK